MWRINNALWKIQVLFGILFNFKKLWYLPELIRNMCALYHHELDLHDDFLNATDSCDHEPNVHKIYAEHYADVLGPFVIPRYPADEFWTSEEIAKFNASLTS